jgi:hypothetical protein
MDDPRRFARAAYYNTTGVRVDGRLCTRPRIIGHIRFNGMGGFNPNDPAKMIGRVFECEEPGVWHGQNKVLFKTLLPSHELPDRYLVLVRSREIGRLLVGQPGWSSDDVWVIALSEWQEEQEAMLLMAAQSWVRTSIGRYQLEPFAGRPSCATLRLEVPDARPGFHVSPGQVAAAEGTPAREWTSLTTADREPQQGQNTSSPGRNPSRWF